MTLLRSPSLGAGCVVSAGARPAGTRHAPTELPAAEIRALLADRAPLMDMEVGGPAFELWQLCLIPDQNPVGYQTLFLGYAELNTVLICSHGLLFVQMHTDIAFQF